MTEQQLKNEKLNKELEELKKHTRKQFEEIANDTQGCKKAINDFFDVLNKRSIENQVHYLRCMKYRTSD